MVQASHLRDGVLPASSTLFPLPRNIYMGTQSVETWHPRLGGCLPSALRGPGGQIPEGFFILNLWGCLGSRKFSRHLLVPHHPNLEGDPRPPVSRFLSVTQSVKDSSLSLLNKPLRLKSFFLRASTFSCQVESPLCHWPTDLCRHGTQALSGGAGYGQRADAVSKRPTRQETSCTPAPALTQ